MKNVKQKYVINNKFEELSLEELVHVPQNGGVKRVL